MHYVPTDKNSSIRMRIRWILKAKFAFDECEFWPASSHHYFMQTTSPKVGRWDNSKIQAERWISSSRCFKVQKPDFYSAKAKLNIRKSDGPWDTLVPSEIWILVLY